MPSEKYKVDPDDDTAEESITCSERCEQVKENCLTPGCEPILPDKENWIYTGVLLGVGIIAIVAGTLAGRNSTQGMEVYTTDVKSMDGNLVSALGIQTVYKVVQLFLPGDTFFITANVTPPDYNITIGNSTYAPSLSNTQSILDFESNWTVIFDLGKNICYLQKMNKTLMGSFEHFKNALVQDGGYAENTVNSVTEIGWSVRKAAESEVDQLSSYVRTRCKEEKRQFIRLVETGLPPLIKDCVESYLPEYALRRNGTDKDLVQLVDIKMIPRLDLDTCPLTS